MSYETGNGIGGDESHTKTVVGKHVRFNCIVNERLNLKVECD
jgi:hypothetical protein